MEPATTTPAPSLAPPIDWARALSPEPALTRYEAARVMSWLAQHGWRREGAEWWGPLPDDDLYGTFTLEWALRTQAARSAEQLLSPRGWEAYGPLARQSSGPWFHHERLRRGRARCSILEALQAEQLAEVAVH